MNIEEILARLWLIVATSSSFETKDYPNCIVSKADLKTLLTAYEKEKEKNKKAIDFINERKKTVNKDMAEGNRLQVGTFMWQVDELLEILKEE